MGTSHTFFATRNDTETILTWLRDAGARQLTGEPIETTCEPTGRERVCHFPSIGPVELWPHTIASPPCGDNTPRAKSTILAMLSQRGNPGRPLIDVDRSAVAGIQLPELRDGRYWVAGHIWFPTSKLKDVFPDLNRICRRLERFLRTHPTVFDNTKGADAAGFGRQICSSGVLQQIVALPEAYALLKDGAYMVDYMSSRSKFSRFRLLVESSRNEESG